MLVVLAALALIASACADGADETAVDPAPSEDTAATDPTDTSDQVTTDQATTDQATTDQATTDQATTDQATADLSAVWILDEGETSVIVDAGSAVNVQDVAVEAVDGVEYLRVVATGQPDYTSTVDADQLEFLSSRPNADTDFDDGAPTVEVGDTVTWGADIGYVNDQCAEGAGQGYWPPGPGCPTTQATEAYFPLSPTMAADGEEAETGLGKLGLWVNGVSIYGWGDGMSYENGGVWQNLAPSFEVYDLDVCDGHAANGDYHHHNDADCLADRIGDTGDGHSPVYGIAADGYPVHGPWVAEGVLARSSWSIRDYNDADSATGCGEAGARTCLMIDRLDPSAGTETASQEGPRTSDIVSTLRGNIIQAVPAVCFEDYYFDASLDDGTLQALDEHNGHDHDDLGYHYHVTLEADADGHTTNVFPYFIGETFAGVLADNAVAQAGGAGGPGAGGPGDGGPPGDGPPPGG
ncbi:MAG: YHYH protein [Actinomycetota bacterium]